MSVMRVDVIDKIPDFIYRDDDLYVITGAIERDLDCTIHTFVRNFSNCCINGVLVTNIMGDVVVRVMYSKIFNHYRLNAIMFRESMT